MKRRTFFCVPLLGLFSSNLIADNNSSFSALSNQASSVFKDLSNIFSDPINAASLGERYLDSHPGALDSEKLLLNIGIDNHSTSQSYLAMFESQRSEDYRLGNTILFEGWILSTAEVSLCCAISLLLTNA